MGGVLEGQALEVHAVDTGDGKRRNRDRAEDGKNFHDLVGAVGDGGEIDVEGVVEEVALGVDGVEESSDVVVGVADVELVLGVDEGVEVALEVERDVASVDEDAAETDQLALDGEDGRKDFAGGVVECQFVFELVDAIVEVVDGGKVEVDNGVEDEIEELAGGCCRRRRGGRARGFLGGGTGGVGDGIEGSLCRRRCRWG